MFEIGDSVMITSFDQPIHGTIVNWEYDEGNVWIVVTDGGNVHDCYDDELTHASHAKPYNGNEWHIYS